MTSFARLDPPKTPDDMDEERRAADLAKHFREERGVSTLTAEYWGRIEAAQERRERERDTGNADLLPGFLTRPVDQNPIKNGDLT